jgi:hypothetical protein
MSNMKNEGILSVEHRRGVPLDIRCPLHYRIRDGILGQAFRRIFERHDDLRYLRLVFGVFSVLPAIIRMAVMRLTSTDNTTRRDS